MGPLAGGEQWRVDAGDCRPWLVALPADYAHAAITSPPYYGLRKYLPDGHPAVGDEVGSEGRPDCLGWAAGAKCGECYVCRLVEVFAGVRRVLRRDGVLWLNLGDSYAMSGMGGNPAESAYRKQATNAGSLIPGRRPPPGFRPKDMLGIPHRVAFALQADGWHLRADCVWHKRNAMPESVRDRPARSHEYVFMLTKSARNYFDMEAVKESNTAGTVRRLTSGPVRPIGAGAKAAVSRGDRGRRGYSAATGRNLRSVWDIPVRGCKDAHFAVMAPALARRCLLASTSEEGVCPHCGSPWRRVVGRERRATRPGENTKVAASRDKLPAEEPGRDSGPARFERSTLGQIVGNRDPQRHVTETRTVGWEPGCGCADNKPAGAIVLDPFAGAGTTVREAVRFGRRAIGCELNETYAILARNRIKKIDTPSLF
jgi:DNA modification methylase